MNTCWIVFAVLFVLQNVNSANILGLFPHTGKSHQMVFEPLLRQLSENGHHVTVVSFFPNQNVIENYTDISLQGLAGIGLEVLDLSVYEEVPFVLQKLGIDETVNQIIAFHGLSDLALGICKRLMDWPGVAQTLKKKYDIVLVENFNSDCMLGLLNVYGSTAPKIALSSSALMYWSTTRVGAPDNPSFVPGVSTSYSHPMTFMDRLGNTLLQIYFKTWYRYAIQVKEQEILEKHFGRKIPDLGDLGREMSLILVNTFHSLNGPRPLVPGLVEVGGMHLNEKTQVIPEYIQRFLDESEEGVVLMSFGSLIKTSTIPKYKEEIIMRTFSRLKQRVIWKYEDCGEMGTLEGNVLKVKWLPQYDLLKHKKVLAFIAHGGLLGMTEAIAAAKPMLVIPFFGDQPRNAADAVAAGLAKTMVYADISEDSFYAAVKSVLTAEMRLSARQASQKWWDRPRDALDTAVYWTERVIRWGYTDPIHSPARDLSFIEYYLFDIAAVVIIFLFSIVLTAKYILTKFIQILFKTSEKKKKVL